MAKKGDRKELGKGIRALLKNVDQGDKSGQENRDTIKHLSKNVMELPIDFIEPNPFQPRNKFTEDALNDLAESIKVHGLIQPITVRRLNEESYQIISGERRFRAFKLAGLKEIPAYIRIADDQEMLEMALVENIQREDLNPIEIAISYKRLMEECDLTHKNLSNRLSINRSTVTNYVRLLKLPPDIQNSIKEKKISMGHARALAGIDSLQVQLHVFKEILRKRLSVRATEKLIRQLSTVGKANSSKNKVVDAQVRKIQEDLSTYFNKNVKINRSQSGNGKIVLHFKNDDEFNEILDLLDM